MCCGSRDGGGDGGCGVVVVDDANVDSVDGCGVISLVVDQVVMMVVVMVLVVLVVMVVL